MISLNTSSFRTRPYNAIILSSSLPRHIFRVVENANNSPFNGQLSKKFKILTKIKQGNIDNDI